MTASRRLLLPLLALAGACSLTACGGSDDGGGSASTTSSATSSPSSPSSPSSTTDATSPSATTSSPATTTSSTTGGTGSGTAATTACSSSDVTVTVTAAGGAAGHVLYTLTATARPGHTCTLRGYPGVSLVAAKGGSPIGHPAVRVGGPASTVTLTPGRSATSALQLAQAANYDGCTQRKTAGFNVYLPDRTDRLFVAATATGCTQTSIELLQAKPFAS